MVTAVTDKGKAAKAGIQAGEIWLATSVTISLFVNLQLEAPVLSGDKHMIYMTSVVNLLFQKNIYKYCEFV